MAAVATGCGDEQPAATTTTTAAGFDRDRAFADLRRQVEFGPRPSGSPAAERTARYLAGQLRGAGAEDVTIQRPLRNVVATIPGSERGYIVLGAHYDTKDGIPGFFGANDGASGPAVVLELARTLPNPMPGPGLAIALFDGEEARGARRFQVDGMRGSRQYVEMAESPPPRQGTPARERIEAMILLDMVGDCDLAIPRESHSDVSLYRRIAAYAPELLAGETIPIDDDHLPFLEAGIPAVDLIDFSYGPGSPPGAWWHSPRDTLDKVCPESLGAIGAALESALGQPGGLG